jgi:hypothetical protein
MAQRQAISPLARDGREHAIRLLDELGAGQRPRWTLVDAAWTPEASSAANIETTRISSKQEKTRSPLTDSNRRPPPYHAIQTAAGGNRAQPFRPSSSRFGGSGGPNVCHRLRPLCSIPVPSQSARNARFRAWTDTERAWTETEKEGRPLPCAEGVNRKPPRARIVRGRRWLRLITAMNLSESRFAGDPVLGVPYSNGQGEGAGTVAGRWAYASRGESVATATEAPCWRRRVPPDIESTRLARASPPSESRTAARLRRW